MVARRRKSGRLIGYVEPVEQRARRAGCTRWPANMRLASQGRLVPGRCRATNLCDYCRELYTVETVEALTLDALGGDAPGLWVVLTAREHLTRAEFNEALRVVRQRLGRAGWRFEYFCQIEFQKRGALHANLLIKLRAGGTGGELIEALTSAWCAQVESAGRPGQWGELIVEEQGGAYAVSRYISKELAHGMKKEQAPPIGWRGHRTSHSRGYFGRPMREVRRDARASLQVKRELYKAEQLGAGPELAASIAAAAVERDSRRRWELVAVTVSDAGELLRVRPAAGGDFREVGRSPRAGDHFRVADALWNAAAVVSTLPLAGRDPVPELLTTAALFTLPSARERYE